MPISNLVETMHNISCSSGENVTLIYTQQHLTTIFILLKSLDCIYSICKVVHLVKDLIWMNCCWRGLKGLVILWDLQQSWQTTRPSHPSQIAFRTSRVKRFLGLPSDLLIVLLTQRTIPIILTMWIYLIHD